MSKTSTRIRTVPSTPAGSAVPHSWPVSNWPPSVYPNDARKAHYFVRVHAAALLEARAIVRIGRERVVIGEPFVKWLTKQGRRMPGYAIAPNRERVAQLRTSAAP
jgi:hypothetical protein